MSCCPKWRQLMLHFVGYIQYVWCTPAPGIDRQKFRYTMKGLQDASNELMEHMIFMLKHAMGLKKDKVHPMSPVALLITGEKQIMKTFSGSLPEEGNKMFDQCIREMQPDYAIYAKDGFFTDERGEHAIDAVILVGYDRKDADRYIFAQKFIPALNGVSFQEVGHPVFAGIASGNDAVITMNTPEKPWWRFW
ncbi:hypothetical protein [Chitinophaga solisilvae]|uniref:hypothetical protein n=1 Tax=Chitinophaga solisilvae TaxID=1233460 RepID=UPI001370107B|nr:hypothetical protein [Chitinophaga solisilvae]